MRRVGGCKILSKSKRRHLGVGTEANWRAPCRATSRLIRHFWANKKKAPSRWAQSYTSAHSLVGKERAGLELSPVSPIPCHLCVCMSLCRAQPTTVQGALAPHNGWLLSSSLIEMRASCCWSSPFSRATEYRDCVKYSDF